MPGTGTWQNPAAVARLLPLLALCLVLAACGEDRTAAPDAASPLPPSRTVQASFPKAGLAFRAPRNWQRQPGSAPLVATVASGRATVALWRYPRQEPLPADRSALDSARKALVASVRARDPAARLSTSKLTRLQGHDAILLLGRERIAGQPRGLRSLHLFAAGSEYVVDAYADPPDFARLDREVFRPLILSLRISNPR